MKVKQKIVFLSIGSIIGVVSGYIYYVVKGCESGCMIWSSPYLSSAVSGLLGFLITDLILDQISKTKKV